MSGLRVHSQRAGRETFEVDVRYSNFEPIGDGSYGFVCSAQDNVTGKRVAVKKVKDIFRDLGDAKRILRELKLLRHFCSHENVVTILDIMVHPGNSPDFRDVYIVTNLMESDLQKIISSTQPLTDQHYHYFLYQLLRGLKYIHSANVLHRDLKPSNLVLNANCDLAICDFGLARGVEQEGSETLTEYVQTRWYRAPELLCYSSTYDTAVDMWSVGCIFAELLGRKPFFQGKNPMHQLQMIVDVLGCPSEEDMCFIQDKAARAVVLQQARQAGARRGTGGLRPLSVYFPTNTSPLALDLLAKMLVFNPKRRIGVEEALEHPYLADLHAQMLGKEPVCPTIFDFDFEKNGNGGLPNGGLVPKKQRVIPSGELKALVLEEVLAYRPSARGSSLLLLAQQAAAEQRQRQTQAPPQGSWVPPPAAAAAAGGGSPMDAQGYEAFSSSPMMGLDELSPMSGIGPGMTTPTPGMHGYPGAMAYSRAVPERGGVAAQQPARGGNVSSDRIPASPAAVAAAVAAATAAAASSSSLASSHARDANGAALGASIGPEGPDGIGMFPAGISDGRSGTETGGGWARKADPQQSDYAQSGKAGPMDMDQQPTNANGRDG